MLAVIAENKEDLDSFKNFVPPASPSTPTSDTASPKPQPYTVTTPTSTTPKVATPISPQPVSGRILASPYAKTLARERNIELTVSLNYMYNTKLMYYLHMSYIFIKMNYTY